MAPFNAAGKVNRAMNEPSDAWLVVRKGFSHPEAIIKAYNLFTRLDNSLDPMSGKFYGGDPALGGAEGNRKFGPNLPYLGYADIGERDFAAEKKVLDGTAKPETLVGNQLVNYQNFMKYRAGDHTTPMWTGYASYFLAASQVNDPAWNRTYGEFYGITPTMETKWETLRKLEQEAILQIIMGEKDVSYFDTFVSQWKSLGGDQITAEVRASLKK
jgi:putative aldouronate transport system substrate-binding protein